MRNDQIGERESMYLRLLGQRAGQVLGRELGLPAAAAAAALPFGFSRRRREGGVAGEEKGSETDTNK